MRSFILAVEIIDGIFIHVCCMGNVHHAKLISTIDGGRLNTPDGWGRVSVGGLQL